MHLIDQFIKLFPVSKLAHLPAKNQLQFYQGGEANHPFTQFFKPRRKPAPHCMQRRPLRRFGIARNQVGHRLCLREVQLSIQRMRAE